MRVPLEGAAITPIEFQDPNTGTYWPTLTINTSAPDCTSVWPFPLSLEGATLWTLRHLHA